MAMGTSAAVFALLLASGTNPPIVSERQFQTAGRSLAQTLAGAKFPTSWGTGAAVLKEREEGVYELLRWSSRGVENLGRLAEPSEGLAYANVWAACQDFLVVMSNRQVYLYRQTQLARPEPWPFPIAGATCDGSRLFLFPRLQASPESPGNEPIVKVVDLNTFQEEVWWVSPPRKGEEDPLPVYSEARGALTAKGMLWAVGIYSGEVRLFDAQGKERKKLQLPAALLPAPLGAEEVAAAKEKLLVQETGDATKKRPSRVSVLVPTKKVAVQTVGTWGEDFVVVTDNTEVPLVVVLSAARDKPRTFQLPQRFLHKRAVVTEEGLWFVEPAGYFPRELFTGEQTP